MTPKPPGEGLTDSEIGFAATPANIEDAYRELIYEELARSGVPADTASVRVTSATHPTQGPIYMGVIRLVRWSSNSASRVLLGLPLLEGGIRKHLRGSWLLESSSFGGLWVHLSNDMLTPAVFEDSARLQNLLAGLV